eukprot:10533064-Alexandrium_andersonii.AAC.1
MAQGARTSRESLGLRIRTEGRRGVRTPRGGNGRSADLEGGKLCNQPHTQNKGVETDARRICPGAV